LHRSAVVQGRSGRRRMERPAVRGHMRTRHCILLHAALVALAAGGCDSATGGSGGAPVTMENAGSFEPDDSWLFSDKTIYRIDLALPASSTAALDASPYTFAIGSVTINGETVPDIGVRLRGKIGSFRTLAKKPKFK